MSWNPFNWFGGGNDVYTDDELYQPDYLPDDTYAEWNSEDDTTTFGTIGDNRWTQDFMPEFRIGGRGDGTQGGVAPSPTSRSGRPSFGGVSFGNMPMGGSSGGSPPGFSRIGNAFISPGAQALATERILNQKYSPIPISYSTQEYGPVLAETEDGDNDEGSWLGTIGRAVVPVAANIFLKNFIG